eukprot:CAMPEP_0118641382 /NCGR_PEP_ID=MMETSP0785-20121206/5251_1 /TAXON_ID=91992 /ORGANISM="Bolidomonas pacifica, Strain CCMP 1866" /LENGTH=146 /DNA_ID=CAMNT_0006532821 /DNA_START=161 /DNA_END=598 /DNA_ORIENTATION=+
MIRFFNPKSLKRLGRIGVRKDCVNVVRGEVKLSGEQRGFWSFLGDEGKRRKGKIGKEVSVVGRESAGRVTELTEKERIEKRRREIILEKEKMTRKEAMKETKVREERIKGENIYGLRGYSLEEMRGWWKEQFISNQNDLRKMKRME